LGFRPRGRLRTELPDQGIGVAVVVLFPARHGTRPFATTGFGAVFEEEDGRRAKERKVAGEEGVANRTVILALCRIAAVVLPGFDAPVAANLVQQLRRWHLLCVQAGDAVAHVLAGLVNLAAAKVVKLAIDPENLSRPGEAQDGAVDLNADQTPLLQSAVFLAGRSGLRGEKNPAVIAGPWPVRRADCPSKRRYNPRPVAG